MTRASMTLFLALLILAPAQAADPPTTGSFAFSFTVELPGPCEEMYDALTGDISGWWDLSAWPATPSKWSPPMNWNPCQKTARASP